MIALESLPHGGNGHEAGRQLLERMYVCYVGGRMPEISLTSRGKPFWKDSSIHFSISHTKDRVFCALSHHPIGIDAESCSRPVSQKLAEKILSPTERVHYDRAPCRETLLKLWVLQEAAAKQTGEGLRGYPRHTDFSPDDPRVRVMDGCYVAVIE